MYHDNLSKVSLPYLSSIAYLRNRYASGGVGVQL
jgi:hypothetical protein